MQIRRDTIGLTVDGSLMRLYVARPLPENRRPGVLFYSDIYQLGEPIRRLADRLAGYGYVVAAPEIFHRREAIGTVIEPDGIGRLRGNDHASNTTIAAYDADAAAVSLLRAGEIKGALLTIFGSRDPHVPADARNAILAALAAWPELRHHTLLYDADHTFMRDDGERWDPQCADQAWGEMVTFLGRELG